MASSRRSEIKPRGSRRPLFWWTTVKGGRRAMRRPWKWRDPQPRAYKRCGPEKIELPDLDEIL